MNAMLVRRSLGEGGDTNMTTKMKRLAGVRVFASS
jgi:hypothetical protein